MPNETALEPTQGEETAVAEPYVSIFDEPEAGEESSSETGEVEELEEGEAEAEGATEDAEETDWLPDTQLKEFPAEVIAKYAKRYGYTEEEIAADPRLSKALKDKINSDIEIANRKKAEEEAEEETEEVAEVAEPTPEEAAKLQTQREAKLTDFVHQITDKPTAIKFTQRLAAADAIKDPEQRAVAVTEALTMGMANVFPNLFEAYFGGPGGHLEQIIGNYIKQNLPGLSESHAETARAQTVDRVAAANPKYAALGLKFGTPEFLAAATKAAKILPGMEKVALPFEQKVEMMFSLLTNMPGAVATATAAIEKGKNVERESRQRKVNATLGAGHSKGQAQKSTGNDDIFGAPGEIQISGKLIGKPQS